LIIQLDFYSVERIEERFADDEESLNKVKALKIVDETLRDLEVYEAPANFSEKVMNLIANSAKSINRNKLFLHGIISVFG
jgi:hypothetical protein